MLFLVLQIFVFIFCPLPVNSSNSSIVPEYRLEEYPHFKYCHSEMNVLDGSSASSYVMLSRYLNRNCTHIYGDVVIENIFRYPNQSEPDMSFLASILEINGCLLIRNTNLSIIPLVNLRVIRGISDYSIKYGINKPDSVQILTEDNFITSPSTNIIFDLRNLRSIVNGNVVISDKYCSALSHINWQEIIEDISHQKIKGICQSKSFLCSLKCPVVDSKRHCWGPNKNQCQIMSKCRERPCDNRCFISKKNIEECCNSECLGGCTSNTRDSCFACKSVLNGTNCLSSCSHGLRTITELLSPNHLTLNDVCVKKCPKGMLEENGRCQIKCTLKNYERKAGKCLPCREFCEKICSETDIHSKSDIVNSMISLNYVKIKLLANCTDYRGSISIDSESFRGQYAIRSIKDLENLKKLQIVEGYVHLDFEDVPFPIDNLSFLSNLERIKGLEKSNPVALAIMNSRLKLPALNKLSYINPAKYLAIVKNPEICYINKTEISKLLNNNRIILTANKDENICVKENKICDKQCLSKFGCWGPGPDNCHNCKNKQLGNICAENCSVLPGFYSNLTSENTKVCSKCHDQCKLTCNGPKPNQCIGGCKNLIVKSTCVETCPYNYYKQSNGNECFPCHNGCHPRNLTMEPVCTGPLNVLGKNGCNKCKIIINDDDTTYCSNVAPQTKNYFKTDIHIRSLQNHSKYLTFFEKFSDIISVYKRCHALCSECTLNTPQRVYFASVHQRNEVFANWGGCMKCRGFWHNNICVKSCPVDVTYLTHDITNTSKGNCISCHLQCLGCYGTRNYECFKCRNHKMYDATNKSFYSCVSQCPQHYKHVIFNPQTHENECYYVLLSTIEWVMVVLGLFVIIILIVSVIIIFKVTRSKTVKRRAQKLYMHFSNANEADSDLPKEHHTINYLPIISIDNLSFDTSNEIGKGAFGSVYRGEWFPDQQYFDDKQSLNSCRNSSIEVAIKTLNSSGSQHEFMEEVKVMASVRHKHCLRLIGVCFTSETSLIISSYLPCGSMDRYLKQNKPNLDATTLLLWAEQIANGMFYLEQIHIIHRDLATRNVLINNTNHIQITDFGLAKITSEERIKISTGIVPVRWLAIETLRDGIYSHKTDVWAYAVTLWEIFTFGDIPYRNINANEIRSEIIKGQRLNQPKICHLEIYILMLKCWNSEPQERPAFRYLWDEFKRFCKNPNKYLSIVNSETNNTSPVNIIEPYLEMASNERLNNNHFNIPKKIEPFLMGQNPIVNGMYQPADDYDFGSPSIMMRMSPSGKSFSSQRSLESSRLLTNTSEYLEPQNPWNDFQNNER